MSNNKVKELFIKALQEYNNNNFVDAINKFEDVNSIIINDWINDMNNTNIESIENIGVCYSKLGKHEKAIKQFEKALNLIEKEEEKEQLNEKEKENLELIKISTYTNKISSLFKLKLYKDIISFVSELLKKIENISYCDKNKVISDFYIYKGIAEYYLKNDVNAIESYQQAIKFNPYNMKAYNNIGIIYQDKNNQKEAKKYFTLGVEFNEEEEIKMYVQSLSGYSFGLTLKTKYQCVIFDFISIFSKIDYDSGIINFVCTCEMTEELSDKIKTFVSKYSISDTGKLFCNNMIKRFTNIKKGNKEKDGKGDYFCILPGIDKVDINQYFHTMINLMKESGQASENIENYKNDFHNIFSTSLKLYDINFTKNEYNKPYKGKGKNENTHNKFICKYCGKEYDNIESHAHTITESLGGNIIDEEECKECNNRFSKTIEVDLNQYLAPWKTIYGIKGKNKIPNFERNSEGFIRFIEKGKLEIGSKNIELDKNGMPTKIWFNVGKINMQNLYRAFVKMSIGSIKSEIVNKDFKKTIDFINGKLTNQKLPPIISYFNPYVISKDDNEINNVFLNLFYRKENTSDKFPYLVSEFTFYNFSFIYIIPFSKKDIYNFSEEDTFEYFHKHWHSYKFNYGLIKCNKDKYVDFRFSINLSQNDEIRRNM